MNCKKCKVIKVEKFSSGQTYGRYSWTEDEVELCPFHQVAPELLEACKRASEALQDAAKFSYKSDPYFERGGEGYDANIACLLTIAKAEK